MGDPPFPRGSALNLSHRQVSPTIYALAVSNTFKAIRSGIKAGVNAMKSPQPRHFQAAGKTIVCSHCGYDGFVRAGLAGITMAGYGVKCCRCDHIEYFGAQPTDLD